MGTIRLNQSILLENGTSLAGLEVSFETFGKLNSDRSNVVWVCHALTANANVLEWWNPLFEGEAAAFPLTDYFVVCVNVLGSCYGTTGPLSINPETGQPYYHAFPEISIRDMVKVHQEVAAYLGLGKIEYLIGASLGGQQALEWAISETKRFENLVLLATNAKHSSWGIAFNESQRLAIENDPSWKLNRAEAGLEGMKVARSIALLSYRTYAAYVNSQVDDLEETKEYKAASYQRYQGEKLAKRFNAFSYYYLSKAMDSHHVGRGRESIQKALSKIQAKTLIIGVSSDQLFPIQEQELLHQYIKNAELSILQSAYGHDAFLIEAAEISRIIKGEESYSNTDLFTYNLN